MTDDQNVNAAITKEIADVFFPLMPNGWREKDCTTAEMAGFERAWKKAAVALDRLWDEAAAVLDPPKEYGQLPDIVFRTLFATLLALAKDKGVKRAQWDVLEVVLEVLRPHLQVELNEARRSAAE
jgi:hypothetical protein